MKTRIHIRKDAVDRYIDGIKKGEIHGSVFWADVLKEISDRWWDVDTKYLYQNTFRLSTFKLMIIDVLVDKIENDEREGKGKCNACGVVFPYERKCPFCGDPDFKGVTKFIINYSDEILWIWKT